MKKWKVNIPSRLLTFVKEKCPSFTTKDVRFAIEHNQCSVNGAPERFASTRLKKGDIVSFHVQKRPLFRFESTKVLYEEDDFLAYDKPPGIASEKLAELLNLELVHRLDRDTTGVMLFAKTTTGKEKLENLFRERKIQKSYLAVIQGLPNERTGVIDARLEKRGTLSVVVHGGRGKSARTEWELLQVKRGRALVRCRPITGRMHQIRAHFSHLGFPLVGDIDYGGSGAFRPLLHAESISFDGIEIHSEIDIEKFLMMGYHRS